MPQPQKSLQSDLDLLRQSCLELSDRMMTSATEIREQGLPPKLELADSIRHLQQEFEELRERISRLAKSINSIPESATEQLDSFKQLDFLSREVALHLTRQQAENILSRIIGLRHTKRADFEPLQACRNHAQQILNSLKSLESTLPKEVQALAEGEHAFVYLLQIIDHREELDEDQLFKMEDAVLNNLNSYGRSLWNSALLGRITLFDQPHPPKPTPDPLEPETTSTVLELTPIAPNRPDSEAGGVTEEIIHLIDAESEIALIDPRPQDQADEGDQQVETDLGKEPGAETQVSAPNSTTSNLSESQELATEPKDNRPPSERLADSACDAVWRLLSEDRLALAYHLAQAIETFAPHQRHAPPWLLQALALSRHVRHDAGELAQVLLRSVSEFSHAYYSEENEEWNQSIKFLLIAASLRPALLTPIAGAGNILRQVYPDGGLDQLYQYCSAIAEFARFRRPLNLSAIKSFLSTDQWKQAIESLGHEVQVWESQRFDFDYGQARDVWKHWFTQEGEKLHDLLDAVKNNDSTRLGECAETLKYYSDDNKIAAAADQTNRSAKVNGKNAQRIVGKAQKLLKKHLREAMVFGGRWLELHEARPGRTLDKVGLEALDLRDKLTTLTGKALSQLNEFEFRRGSSLMINSCLECCRRSIKDVAAIFDRSLPLPMNEPLSQDLLHADLLRISNIWMDENWEPEIVDPKNFLADLCAHTAACTCNWETAFNWRVGEGDHEATLRIIEYLERHPETFNGDLNKLRAAREKHLGECLRALQEDLETTRQEIEQAVWHGIFTEQERVSYMTQVEEIEWKCGSTIRFNQQRKRLASIRRAIEEQRLAECETLRKWLEKERHSPHSPINATGRAAAIEQALEHGDVWSADEYLSGQSPVHLSTVTGDLEDFFPHLSNRIIEFLQSNTGQPPWLQLVDEARAYAAAPQQGGALGPVILPASDHKGQSALIARLIEAWRLAKDQRRLDLRGAEDILRPLGFKAAQCTPLSDHGVWMKVTTEQLHYPDDGCPTPQYGSLARCSYRLYCVWSALNIDNLLRTIGETALGLPIIVFYFGWMSEAIRRSLARQCLSPKRTLLVIDEALLLYLCSKPDSAMRLRGLFNCALPFTFLNPYEVENSDVPPEMFVGRVEEKRKIIDPGGACFIYGGRRLGKTALLRAAQREFNNPAQGRIALFLDLKTLLAKNGTRLSSLWGELAYLLRESAKQSAQDLGEFSGLSRQSTANTLFEAIRKWIKSKPERRLLLLLDEADRFLDLDSRQENGEAFAYVTRLKELMTSTDRGVKVVFAGLHNVQRTTHLPNHPLTRLGEPICVGPLLDNEARCGEAQAAIDLILRPLSALGYRFEQPQLLSRILWQTNYYPNLIQLYCSRLLELLTDRNRGLASESDFPPRLITLRHLQEVYQSAQLRNDIRLRFRDTLDLDKRYLLIANAIAFDSKRHSHTSFTAEEIRQQATSWWPEGFKDSAQGESFRVLLDEMVGLGVLHKPDDDCYTLRSHNVALLIGTESEIGETLELSADWQVEEPYGAAIFREAYGETPALRSPLTADQESLLRKERNGVTLLTGCLAGGLRELPNYLSWSFGEDYFINVDAATDLRGFELELEKLNHREIDGVTLMLVAPSCPWNESWIEAAQKKLKKLRAHHSYVQIAFTADPLTLWQLLDAGQLAEPDGRSRYSIIKLTPWHDLTLRQWLSDCSLPNSDDDRARISVGTGKWPSLLMRLINSWLATARPQNNLKTKIQEIREQDELNRRELGLTINGPTKVLEHLAQWGETIATEELLAIDDELSMDLIQRSLFWAEWLSLAAPLGNGCWQVNQFTSAVLQARSAYE